MAHQESQFEHERQPVRPFNAGYRTINELDQQRETRDPRQLDLLPSPQPDLFVEQPAPQGTG